MSNDPDLRVSRSLELLAALKETGAAFAKKEAQLASEIAARRHSAGRKYREAMEKIASSQTSRIAEIDARLKSEEARLNAIHESRAARIQRLESAGIRDLPKRAQEAKAKWMGDLQMKQFLAQRKQTSDLEAADSAFADFSAKLAAQRAILLRLERRARYFLSGYITYLRGLARKRKEAPEAVSDSGDRIQLFEDLKERLEKIEGHLRSFRELLLPRVFSYMPLPPLILVVIIGAVAFAWNLGATPASDAMAGLSAAAILAGLCAVHRAGLRQSHPAAAAITSALSEAHRIHDACSASSSARHVADRRKVEEEFAATSAAILEQWNRAGEIESEFEQAARKKIETQVPRLVRRHQAQLKPRLDRLSTEHSALLAAIQAEFGSRNSSLSSAHESEVAALVDEERTRWTELQADWNASIAPLYDAVSRMNAVTELKFPPWDARFVDSWAPPTDFTSAARFGALDLDLAAVAEAIPRDPRLSLPGSSSLSIPLSLCFPDQGSLLFESNESCGPAVALVLNNIILRLLSTTPPGKISFTIIDPVGLGQNFAGLMHLSDYEESLINRRIWTQKDQIEERLADLSEHIEKVIQMYLRNEYATITEYNAQAGGVAEKYHFLILADFPANITETAARRLQSIAVSGPRCGIYPLIHWDQRQPLPEGIAPDELRKSCVCLRRVGKEFVLSKKQSESGAVLLFDSPPDPDLAAKLVHRIGKSSIDSNRVEVPFAQVAPKPSEFWTNETTNELKIAVGRTGATKLQYLAMGKGTRQHALFAGKTGSGKSTLFHVIITNLALACSPAEVEFYLVDFKKGVEFKCYAAQRLPHARVVAIESDREFGLSVLQRVDEELKRRGDRFRKLGVQDVAGYKKAGGAEPIPRCLLIIDEFQEFFIEDDSVAQAASVLLDRIVRQGRAFGIHVLLGSQTLGGAYSLARATLGQMVIRVALQCNEADAYLIMDDNNSAPRLLSRPGEGIYNDAAGAIEGNSPFQVVWLPDEERDQWLEKVHDIAVKKGVRESSPIVFEGNAPADIRENDLLRAVLDSEPVGPPAAARAWLGAPNSIKGPTEVVFQRQSGNHLLIVGQRDEAALTLLGVSLLALAAQYPPGAARFVLFDGSSPGSRDAEFLGCIIEAARQEVTLARGNELAGVMNEIAASMKARSAGDDAALTEGPLFLFIHGLQKFKKLRHEDDFDFSSSAAEEGPGPGARLNDFICEGSSLGMHLLVTIDTFNNVSRFMSRKALSEFEMRVVFQMGANDSSSLIDSPKASNLGLHRALFYNEHEGHLETFRPYAPPSPEWLRQTARKLSQLHA